MITVTHRNRSIKCTTQEFYDWLVNTMDNHGINEKKASCVLYWLPSISDINVHLHSGKDSYLTIYFDRNAACYVSGHRDMVVQLKRTGLEPELCNLVETSM